METDADAGCDSARLLAEFRTWLDRERGLSAESVRCYCNQAKCFVAAIGGPGAVSDLDAGMATAFMVEHSKDRNSWSAKAMVTSLRAFLRFAHATGRTAVPLAAAVPAVASWRLSALPRGFKAAEIERLLAGCGITPSCRCWPGSGCAAPRPLGSSSATSTGGPARSRSRARAAAPSGSPFRPRPGRRLPRGCRRAAPPAIHGRCS
jgi:hypothetical protein